MFQNGHCEQFTDKSVPQQSTWFTWKKLRLHKAQLSLKKMSETVQYAQKTLAKLITLIATFLTLSHIVCVGQLYKM